MVIVLLPVSSFAVRTNLCPETLYWVKASIVPTLVMVQKIVIRVMFDLEKDQEIILKHIIQFENDTASE